MSVIEVGKSAVGIRHDVNSIASSAFDVRAIGTLSSSEDNTALFAAALAASPNGRIFIPAGRWPGSITLTANGQGVIGAGKPRYDGTSLVGGTVIVGTVLPGVYRGVELGHFGVDQSTLDASFIDGFRAGGADVDLDANWHDLAALGRGYAVNDSRHAFLIQGGRNCRLHNLYGYKYAHIVAYRASEGVITNIFGEDSETSVLVFKSDSGSGYAQDCVNNRASNIYGRTTGAFAPKLMIESYADRVTKNIVIDNVVLEGGSSEMHVRITQDLTGGATCVTSQIKINNLVSVNNGYSDRAVGVIGASDVTITNGTVINATGASFKISTAPTTKLIGCTSINPGAEHVNGTFQVSEVNGTYSRLSFSDGQVLSGAVDPGNVSADGTLTFYRNAGGGGTTYFAVRLRNFNNQGWQIVSSPSANAKGAENFTRSSIYINPQGRVGIGGTPSTPTDPTAALHLPVGTTAASTSPIKFTTASAALLTTPEAGAFETDGTDLYFTNNAGVRKKVTIT